MHEGFQPARAIAQVLKDIEHQQLVLPAIQREFVWSEAKICSLFDSLMRGYPIGGFLFWRVSDETSNHTPSTASSASTTSGPRKTSARGSARSLPPTTGSRSSTGSSG